MPPLVDASYYSAREFLASQTIALEASDSNTTFHVHEHLLGSVSPVLLAAISREWNEKATRRYKFHEDVTEQVLLCFLIWIYYGSYHEENEIKTVKTRNDEELDLLGFGLSAKEKRQKKKEHVEVPVDGRVEAPANDKQGAEQTTEGSDNLHPILLHIKLYVFAEMYMIEALKTVSMQKMIAQLKEFGSLAEGHERAAIFDVLTYAFSSRLPGQDVLLHWLARYASWRLDELKQVPLSFDKLLLETDGNFATLLVRYVQKSSINPFSLKTEEIMPRYPISMARR